MARKTAEPKFRDLMKRLGNWWHKYGDVRYCMHCHQALPKSENAPDFFTSVIGAWVEVKNNDKSGRWAWTEIYKDGARANQRNMLLDNAGWLFIELGTGKAPNGRGAFLIPFIEWCTRVEPILLERDQKSIRLETIYNQDGTERNNMIGADNLLEEWRLNWVTNVGWEIPPDHVWFEVLQTQLEAKLEDIKTWRQTRP